LEFFSANLIIFLVCEISLRILKNFFLEIKNVFLWFITIENKSIRHACLFRSDLGSDMAYIHAHFEETCYEPNKRRLKHPAVPAKFPPISDVVCESATSRKRKAEYFIMEVVDTPPKIGPLGKNNICSINVGRQQS
jgi:hypothetical protein